MIYKNNFIHAFEKKGSFFLLEIKSLAIFELNKLSYDLLNMNFPTEENEIYAKFKTDYEINDIRDCINTLKYWDIISCNQFSNVGVFRFPNYFDNVSSNYWVNGLYLLVSQDCNLRCKYCSAEYGKYGKNDRVKLMDEKTAKKALDFILKYIGQDMDSFMLTFVGGEPLLNFNIIKFSYEYLKSKTNVKIVSNFNTNGTLLTEDMAKWLSENEIPARFSIDGTKETHDSNRIYVNGKGSYDDAIRGLKNYLIYNHKGVAAQTSIPKGKYLKENVHSLWEKGVELVIANYTGESAFLDNSEHDMTDDDWRNYINEWEQLCDEVTDNILAKNRKGIALPVIFLNYFINRRGRIPGCSVGRTISITPNEEIYPCQGLVGFDNYLIGNLTDGINYEKLMAFGEVYSKYLGKCNDCWARCCCGTGCIASSIQYNELGDEYQSSRLCNFSKNAIENAIYMYNIIQQKNPKLLTPTKSLDRFKI